MLANYSKKPRILFSKITSQRHSVESLLFDGFLQLPRSTLSNTAGAAAQVICSHCCAFFFFCSSLEPIWNTTIGFHVDFQLRYIYQSHQLLISKKYFLMMLWRIQCCLVCRIFVQKMCLSHSLQLLAALLVSRLYCLPVKIKALKIFTF